MRLPEETVLHPTVKRAEKLPETRESSSMIEDQRPGQAAAVSHAERRKNPRTAIRRLAYVNLGPYDNGGVITDISRDGLRFHVVNPVEQGGLVRLSILLGGTNQLEVVGELIWMDATRKVGGVRFTVLPDGAAEQILNWAQASTQGSNGGADTFKAGVSRQSEAQTPAATDDSATPIAKLPGLPHTAPVQTPVEANARAPWVPPSARPAAGATSQTRPQDSPNAGTALPQPWMRPVGDQQPSAMPWITHFDPDPAQRSSIFVRGVIGGIIFCALVGSAGWFGLRHYGSQNGSIQISSPFASDPVASSPLPSGPVPSGALAPQPALPPADRPSDAKAASDAKAPSDVKAASDAKAANSPQPEQAATPLARPNTESAETSAAQPKAARAPEASPSPQRPLPQGPIAEGAPAKTLSAEKGSPAAELGPQQNAKVPASQPAPSADAGESQLMLARQYLDGHAQSRNPTVASHLLWAAVEKGNLAAEMDLADLYLRGDGVAKNCDQARVLLSAASGKGNTEAMQKLSELNRTGCR